jgi:hypothetical protein
MFQQMVGNETWSLQGHRVTGALDRYFGAAGSGGY